MGLFDDGDGSFSLGAFDSAAPGSVCSTPITGLAAGDTLDGIDFRPATGVVYGFSGTSGNVYTLSLSGAATTFSTLTPTFAGTNSTAYGFDFNPFVVSGTLARIITDTDFNRVVDAENGNDSAGNGGSGYFETTLNVLVTVANNAGTFRAVGDLGIGADQLGGFDFKGTNDTGFLAFQDGDDSVLYTIDIADGSADLVGGITGSVIGLTAVPEPSSALLIGLAGLGFFARRRR